MGQGNVGWQLDPEADGTLTLDGWKRARAAEDRRRRIDDAFARLRAVRQAAGDALSGMLEPESSPAAGLRATA